jgi:hypothetical protein
MSEYRKRTYDPAWVLKFCDTFDGKEMKTTRSRAAKALSDDGGKLNGTLMRRPTLMMF